ncbi:hypothetical protein [Yersinia aldovae]|nr:hypothetical protein [Yersinia aldovae]
MTQPYLCHEAEVSFAALRQQALVRGGNSPILVFILFLKYLASAP